MLQRQYQLVKGSREALFSYLFSLPTSALNTPVDAFNQNTIARLLTHIANCYVYWMANFSFKENRPEFDELQPKTIEELRKNFAAVDETVLEFLERYMPDEIISTEFDSFMEEYPALQIFTHVITHEFHHKGQLLSMSRLLGYVPVDTDVIRF